MNTFAATDADAYKALARHWGASVTVVTAHRDTTNLEQNALAYDGLTATAFLTVSIDPPIVLVSVTAASSAAEVIQNAKGFAVNLLASDQSALANAFAKSQSERATLWDTIKWHAGETGAPLLHGTLGSFEARVRELIPAGDHILVLGDVVAIHHGTGQGSLLYHNRAYGGFQKHE